MFLTKGSGIFHIRILMLVVLFFVFRYCAHFEVTHTKGRCNMRNQYQGWTQMLTKGTDRLCRVPTSCHEEKVGRQMQWWRNIPEGNIFTPGEILLRTNPFGEAFYCTPSQYVVLFFWRPVRLRSSDSYFSLKKMKILYCIILQDLIGHGSMNRHVII